MGKIWWMYNINAIPAQLYSIFLVLMLFNLFARSWCQSPLSRSWRPKWRLRLFLRLDAYISQLRFGHSYWRRLVDSCIEIFAEVTFVCNGHANGHGIPRHHHSWRCGDVKDDYAANRVCMHAYGYRNVCELIVVGAVKGTVCMYAPYGPRDPVAKVLSVANDRVAWLLVYWGVCRSLCARRYQMKR